MKIIRKVVDQINDEVSSAKHYAESYLEAKSNGNAQWTARYKEMAEDEIKHATYQHERAVEMINKWKNVMSIPEEMLEKWTECHNNYIEKVTIIKKMLEY